jgi:hypothetical protein
VKLIAFALWIVALVACSSPPVIAPPEPRAWVLEVHSVSVDSGNGFSVCRASVENSTGYQLHALKGVVAFGRADGSVLRLEFEESDIIHTPGSSRLVAYRVADDPDVRVKSCSIQMVGTRQKQFTM